MSLLQISNPMAVLSDAANAPVRTDYHAVVVTHRHGNCRCRCSDFTDATIEVFRPGESLPVCGDANVLSLHKDLFTLHPLSSIADSMGFFRYRYPEEALHLSQAEFETVCCELDALDGEARYGVDEFTSLLIAQRVAVVLTLVARFFHRQFILRDDECHRAVERVASLVADAYEQGAIGGCGLPDVSRCAAQVGMSDAYFLDVLRYVNGQSFKEFANIQQLRTAKRMLADTSLTVRQVAERLGFPSEGCFSQFFMCVAGASPDDFRRRRS